MCEIWTMGEMLVEIMRPRAEMPLDKPDVFVGPFPSGAPAIFIDTAARKSCALPEDFRGRAEKLTVIYDLPWQDK